MFWPGPFFPIFRIWIPKPVQRSASCRSRRELSNAYFVAKFGFDTAVHEPFQVCPLSAYGSSLLYRSLRCGRSGGLAGDHLIFNLTGLHVGGLEAQEFLSPSLAPAAGRGQSGRDRFGASDLVGLLQDLCTRGKFIHSRGRPGIRGLKRRIRTRPDAFGRQRQARPDDNPGL